MRWSLAVLQWSSVISNVRIALALQSAALTTFLSRYTGSQRCHARCTPRELWVAGTYIVRAGSLHIPMLS